ncbi:hypothetical protein [Chitinophaga arvensicola]|uniref:NVEALA protein n=1 Tax=Chitinophaga arvensicola TaxID=29529 RepID=A0A1I0RP91_9BACT|nr:hypothetical protein [Chitinophaga arvensicola]SEW43076.1 hypothetical protein SAMN04488122_3174 [Chitinophaga arvensicola]
MKNTKLILGALTIVLGIAGAVSSAAASRAVTFGRVLVTTVGGGTICTKITAPCAHGSSLTCKTASLTHRIVWTINSNCKINKYKRLI